MSSTVANINMTHAITRLGLKAKVQLSRADAGGNYVDGRWVSAPNSTVDFTATVQSYIDEQQSLPEEVRTKRLIKVWSTSVLKPNKRVEGTTGDLILWNGAPYEVHQFWDRSTDGNYWTAICVAVDQ